MAKQVDQLRDEVQSDRPEIEGASREELVEEFEARQKKEPVTPEGLLVALDREFEKHNLRRDKEVGSPDEYDEERDAVVAAPIHVPKPVSVDEGLARTAKTLIDWYEEYGRRTELFPGDVLVNFLDTATARIVEAAWLRGEPLVHDDIKRALAALWEQGMRQAGKSVPIVVQGANRKQRRALAKKEKKEVVKV